MDKTVQAGEEEITGTLPVVACGLRLFFAA
jgi:hypothetical protein